MSARLPYDPAVFETWEPQSPFNLVLVYEDDVTRENAGRLYDRLFLKLQSECRFQSAWYGIDEFCEARQREQAAQAAAWADMVVISLHTGRELPAHADRWIESWVKKREDRKSAMVVLVDEPPDMLPAIWPVRSYLQTVARLGRMDFFFHASGATPDLPNSIHAIRMRAETITPVLQESLTPRYPTRRNLDELARQPMNPAEGANSEEGCIEEATPN